MSGMDPNAVLPSDHHRTWIMLSVVMTLLFIGTLVFGVWAYGGRQDYKNNADQKISVAVNRAEQQTQATDAANYAEEAKQPLKPYTGPEAYGSLVVYYPKTWSAYVTEGGNSGNPVDGYFQPNVVPDVSSSSTAFALRVQVQQNAYDQVVQQYQSNAKRGLVTIVPYTPAKVPKDPGVRIDGQIFQGKTGSMVVLPLRANTLLLWTEAPAYEADFNNNILPNFSFSP